MKIEKVDYVFADSCGDSIIKTMSKVNELVDAVNALQSNVDRLILKDVLGEDKRTKEDKQDELRYLLNIGEISEEEYVKGLNLIESKSN